MNDLAKPWGTSVVGVPEPHDSNLEHLTGQCSLLRRHTRAERLSAWCFSSGPSDTQSGFEH